MSFDDIFLKFSSGSNPPVELSLRQVNDELTALGYRIVNREEYDRFMRHQLKVLSTLSQQYRGYDAED